MGLIPTTIDYTIKEGDSGIVVFAVQRACNKLGIRCAEDMAFGPATKAAVQALQRLLGATDDGICGPATQAALATYLANAHETANGLPKNLLASVIAYESGGFLGAVNWSVAGGVDCGVTQRRVYEEDYGNTAVIKRAFDAAYQVSLSGGSFSELYGIFLARSGTGGSRQLAWRLAVLNHNYPSLADRISRDGINGLSSYYRTAQSWVTVHGLHFPDGTAIITPLQWGQRYSLGEPACLEPGQAVKQVNW